MAKKRLLTLIALLVLFTVIGPAIADEEFGVYPPEVTILSSDENGITLRVDFSGFNFASVEVEGTTYQILEIPGCGKLVDVGKPALPVYGTRVPVPEGKYFSAAAVIDSPSISYEGYHVYPAQEPAADIIIGPTLPYPTPPFTIDESFYATDAFYPYGILRVEAVGKFRDNQILPMYVTPFQFNPVSGELISYSSVTIQISFSDSPIIISSVESSEEPVIQSNGDTGCEFLIISHPDLVDAANNLAARRNAEGLITLVVDTDTTGTTAEDIKSYIQTGYDTWNPRPEYVLLLGDANLIPTFYRTVHVEAAKYYFSGFHIGTDLYYAIMNGPEAAPPYYDEYWTPDLAVGRIPADTLDEANNIIDKIVEYEDHQWVSGENAASVAGYFQDANPADGREDRWFISTSEEIRNFLVGEGFVVDRHYTTEPTITPTKFHNGDSLPSDLLRPTYPWDADAADINSAINDGRFVYLHRDHGYTRGWGDPAYADTDVGSLNNNGSYLVLFSIDCEAGWFDAETDEYPSETFESLCEAFINRDQGGAVGVVGATRVSWSGYNDELEQGYIDAIWPNFDTSHGGSQPIMRMGHVLNYGKDYMTQFYSTADAYTKNTFEYYHYFGDPTMQFKIPIENTPPIADPNGPYVVDENTTVIFDGSGSSDSDAGDSISLYEWDLDGDGIFETTGMNPSYSWCDDYTGTITLRVTDTRGATATASTTVTVNNVAPTADAGDDQEVDEGASVSFTGTAMDPGCDTLTFAWDFGDNSSGSGVTPIHAYCDNDTYTVTLTVTDDDGGVGVDTLTVTVNNVAPNATIGSMDQPNPEFILPMQTVTFHGTFSDPGWCDTHAALWSFGDGQTNAGALTEENLEPDATGTVTGTHAYAAPGDYAVTVTVTDDDDGATTSAAWTVHVADVTEAKHIMAAYINNLPDSAFKGNAAQRKNALENMINALDHMITSQAWKGFVQDITNNVRSKADGYVDGNPSNDWIIDPTAQDHICMKIDDIVAYVQTFT